MTNLLHVAEGAGIFAGCAVFIALLTLGLLELADLGARAVHDAWRTLRRPKADGVAEHAATLPPDTCRPLAVATAPVPDQIAADADLLMSEIHAYLKGHAR